MAGVVVEPAWLVEHLKRPGLTIVDLREPDEFEQGHVPGAVQLSLDRLGSSQGGRDNVLLPPEDFSALMEGLGISNGAAIVIYDDQWGLAAARLLWALHYYGHTNVSILDGGWDRWTDEGRPLESGRAAGTGGAEERDVFESTPDPGVAATTAWLADHAGDRSVVLLDTRSEGEYAAGHLPGAVSWDWFNAVPPGSWELARDNEELLAEWEALGVTPEKEAVVYCRSGMRAAHTYVALRRAGFEHVRLYDGSWQEWSIQHESEHDA